MTRSMRWSGKVTEGNCTPWPLKKRRTPLDYFGEIFIVVSTSISFKFLFLNMGVCGYRFFDIFWKDFELYLKVSESNELISEHVRLMLTSVDYSDSSPVLKAHRNAQIVFPFENTTFLIFRMIHFGFQRFWWICSKGFAIEILDLFLYFLYFWFYYWQILNL